MYVCMYDWEFVHRIDELSQHDRAPSGGKASLRCPKYDTLPHLIGRLMEIPKPSDRDQKPNVDFRHRNYPLCYHFLQRM